MIFRFAHSDDELSERDTVVPRGYVDWRAHAEDYLPPFDIRVGFFCARVFLCRVSDRQNDKREPSPKLITIVSLTVNRVPDSRRQHCAIILGYQRGELPNDGDRR